MPWTTSSEQLAPFRCSYLRWLLLTQTLQYILENFSHAPSRDLEPATLHMLVQLMCGQVVCLPAPLKTSKTTVSVQARECLYEKSALAGGEEELVLAQEAAHLSQAYHQVVSEERLHTLTSSIPGSGGHAAGSGLCPLLLALPGPGAQEGISNVTDGPLGETGTLPSACRPARGSMPSLLRRAFQPES